MKTRDGENIDFKYNLKEYLRILSMHKSLLWGLMILGFILAAASIVDKILFKIIIDKGETFLSGSLPKNSFIQTLIIISIVFIVVRLFYTLGTWIRFNIVVKLDSKLNSDIKKKYFNHILGLSHSFHVTHKTGTLISRMNRGTGAIEEMTDSLAFNLSPLIFNIILVCSSIALFSWKATLVVLITTIIFVSYGFYILNLQQSTRLDYNRKRDREKGFIGDVFTNFDSIKYYGKERNIKGMFSKLVEATKSAQIKHGNYYRWFEAGNVLILGIGLFLLIYFPLVSFLNKEITLGTLAFIYSVYGNITAPMFGFVFGMRSFYRSMADFQDLFEYSKIENEIKDKPNAKKKAIVDGTVDFKGVSFDYGRKKAFSLNDFSLKIKKNEKVALVGHSGCGKTTLIKILYRLYDPQKGQVLIDGEDIKNFDQEFLRGELSIVPQECILFDDTIYNNIHFSNPRASRKQVMQSMKFAQLDKVVRNFPQKENTIVGERGIKLSGGEKQRVSIARAILANKKILVLDEATSSLDSETEHEIQKALQNLLQGRTSIIIAHRLSTIMTADRIIVIKDGKIIQQGRHADLIRQSGEYRKLWNLQKGGYIRE